MGTKNEPGEYDCYEKAEPDEPMFVLLARDVLAAKTVREWAEAYGWAKGDKITPRQQDKINEAYNCADAMEKWRKENTDE